jgi:hypothetical protein
MLALTVQQLTQALRYQNAAAPTPEEVARRRRFLERFPNQEANINSYQDNPNCKCAMEIQNALLKDSKGINEIAGFLMGEKVSVTTPKSVAGKVMNIPNTNEAWAELVALTQREMFVFRGISTVLEPDGSMRVLFY